jgi:hypothetical protein
MKEPAYTKKVNFKSLASTPAETSKLMRHWREVLSRDMIKVVSGEGIQPGSGGSFDAATRQKIWKLVCDSYDHLAWDDILEVIQSEQEEGERDAMTTTKLKRHFRDVMRKEGEKAIGK